MKQIKLMHNQYALVDNEDYDKLNKQNWYASYDKNTKGYYAIGKKKKSNGNWINIRMHRIIMNVPSNMQVDHINHNTLDNRKKNLRLCTNGQNHMNQLKCKHVSSKYKGVSWDNWHNKWKSSLGFNGKRIHIGYFNSEVNAAKAYNKKAKELFGEFANTNKGV